jgi:hypothetical protein
MRSLLNPPILVSKINNENQRRRSSMNKTSRTILTVIIILALAGGVFIVGRMFMRMRASGGGFGPGNGNASGGLMAVSADNKPIAADPNSQLPANTAAQKAGNLNVSLALSPYPPVGFQEGGFDVTLTDAQGLPVTDAKIGLDLTMPAMPMPPNTLQAQHSGNGLYYVTGTFTMRGLWRIEVIIQRGGQKQSVFFDVGL